MLMQKYIKRPIVYARPFDPETDTDTTGWEIPAGVIPDATGFVVYENMDTATPSALRYVTADIFAQNYTAAF
jgi:hypothetical protein